MLSETRQSEKSTHGMIPNSRTFWKRQNSGDNERISGCQGLGERGGAETLKGLWEGILGELGDGIVLHPACGGDANLCTC